MKVLIVTPAPPRSRSGNRITALRWAGMLKSLGHGVRIEQSFRDQRCDLLLALHARRSFSSIDRFHRLRPDSPLILALTGTDLYGDIHTDANAARSLDLAWKYILLQPDGLGELAHNLRRRASVVYQSVIPPAGTFSPRPDRFEVVVLGHLRAVKDPFRTALAAAQLPSTSRIQVLHAGAALDPDAEHQALEQAATNPRYRWLGPLPRWRALRLLARSRLLVLTSTMEGGANVVSEALACGTPVVSSRISGSIGLLGSDYPGYYPVGDTTALARLLQRIEEEEDFCRDLGDRCRRLRPLVDPERERASLQRLLAEVTENNAWQPSYQRKV